MIACLQELGLPCAYISSFKFRVCVAGGILQGLMFPLNLGRFGNSIAIWLGIQPYELFFYIFLPPLLFDAAVRIDFYLFKKVCTPHLFPAVAALRLYYHRCRAA